MRERIEILDTMPVILTKDVAFAEQNSIAEPGAIIILPEDAVLVSLPININVRLDYDKK